MRLAYADPPYIGQAKKHYGNEVTYAGEVDHAALLVQLRDEFPDGWALSCSSPSLEALLPLCVETFGAGQVRVAAWVKPFHIFKRGVRPAYAWEPVLFRGGRNRGHKPPRKGAAATTPKDWISANITLRRGLPGAKPDEFCYWVFDLLGMRSGDELADIFPGSGAVTAAWRRWSARSEPHQFGLMEAL